MELQVSLLKFVKYDLSTFVLKNLRRLFDNYAVARTEHDALVKSTTKIFFKFCGLLRKPKLYLAETNRDFYFNLKFLYRLASNNSLQIF